MEPNVHHLFDEVLKRIDDLRADSNERWERWERCFDDTTAEFQERDVATEHRISSLEEFVEAEYTAAIVSDNWGAHFNEWVSDLEHRMVDLELVRVHEICDEHDDRVAAVETVTADLVAWRPEVDCQLDDLHKEVKWLSAPREGTVVELNLPQPAIQPRSELVAVHSFAGVTTDWPSGHCEATTTLE